ncbi:hypothetical protein ACFSTC_47850 [Nonomuraea ferruginea]
MADRWERRRPQDRLYWQVLLGDDPGARAIVQEAHDRLAERARSRSGAARVRAPHHVRRLAARTRSPATRYG